MKKILSLIAVMFFALSFEVCASDAGQAENFIKKVTTEGVEEIVNANISQSEKDEKFAKLFNEYLDLDYIGKFVLGRYWKTATNKQRSDFIKVYREFNVKTWSKRFDEFKGKHFDFEGTSPSNSEGQIFVNTSVLMKHGEAPVKVIWRVKEQENTFKIIDIVIENISLAITARNEYTAFIKQAPNGIDDLIKDLKTKSE